jgi:hypothetical protein
MHNFQNNWIYIRESNCLESLDTQFELYVHLICEINDNNHLHIVIYFVDAAASKLACSERGGALCIRCTHL